MNEWPYSRACESTPFKLGSPPLQITDRYQCLASDGGTQDYGHVPTTRVPIYYDSGGEIRRETPSYCGYKSPQLKQQHNTKKASMDPYMAAMALMSCALQMEGAEVMNTISKILESICSAP